jgi:restriction endonuclease Mrr
LGEVRWFNDPMNGSKMREFLGKLDPRPQTIGLFISHSGLDEGARSVVRRAVNSKTVVVFERNEIETVLLERNDPGAIFDEGLRNAYDYIFEQHHEW